MSTASNQTQLLADLATGLWRLRRRFANQDTDKLPDDARRAVRDVDALLERLAEESIEIQDHTDELYDASLSLTVAAFQPTPGLAQDQILETLKPTVYHGQERIQVGEVIVGIPERTST